MPNDRFSNFDDDIRNLVLHFERTVLSGHPQFFDVDELETIIDYYLEVADNDPLVQAIVYAEQLYPDSLEIKLRRAHWYIANHKFDRALPLLLSLEERDPDNTDIAYSLGVLYGEMGNSERAIDYYLMAAADGWQTGRVYDNIAEEYYKLKRFDDAIDYYRKALSFDDHDEELLYNYIDTCEQAGGDNIEKAASFLDSYAHDHPYSKQAWYCLGCAFCDLALYDRAEEALELALAIDKHYTLAYRELAYAQENNGRVPQAASTLLRTLDCDSDPSAVYSDLGQLYARHDNLSTALSYLRKAVDLNPANPDAQAALAVCYLHSGDLSMAKACAEKAQALDSDNPDAIYCLAMLADMDGDSKQAYDLFDQLLDSDRCLEAHCRFYAVFLYSHQDYNTLELFAIDSLQSFPHDPFYSSYLAAAYFRSNRYNRLRQILPDVNPSLLHDICPEMWLNPHLAPIMPPLS